MDTLVAMAIRRISLDRWLMSSGAHLDDAFKVFDQQDSGNTGYGLAADGRRHFVKVADTALARRSLLNAIRFHDAIAHDTIVRPIAVDPERPALVYPWVNGDVLNHATLAGSDRSALARFRALPVREVEAALTNVLEAHRHITAQGFVSVDFYDGAMLYDFEHRRMHLIDLDDYRPGPFRVEGDRLPGSSSYMAPEEWQQGEIIDERTTVFVLGRTIEHLLESEDGRWRGNATQLELVSHATSPNRGQRYRSVGQLSAAWAATHRV